MGDLNRAYGGTVDSDTRASRELRTALLNLIATMWFLTRFLPGSLYTPNDKCQPEICQSRHEGAAEVS
jgi:hypothetical protein